MPRSHVLLIGGRSGVGKSTIAAETHRQLSEHGVRHAWIEGDNLDMAFPVPWEQGYNLAEANLAVMWSNYRAHGYRRLIYVNPASVFADVIDALTTAMGDDPMVTGVLLSSSDETAETDSSSARWAAVLNTRWDEVVRRLSSWRPPHRKKSPGSRPMDGRHRIFAAEIVMLTGWCA